MDTRIKKYKQYRISILKDGSLSDENIKEYEGKHSGGYTSTLPMQDVMDTIKEEERKEKLKQDVERKYTLKLVISISILVSVLLGIIILAIFAFGRIN